MQNRWWAAASVAAATVILAACGSTASTSSGASTSTSAAPAAQSSQAASTSGAVIKTTSSSVGTVLTNSHGFTLYWFVPDTPTASKCNGACASYWPPVIGKVSAASGVSLSGKFGTIKRSDGQLQATYAGHPLYTYKGDTAAGQVHGNALNASGGLWYAVTPSGAKPAASPSASAHSGGGGGY
jgi:predicted lipoprotein with Yx(FWY)xxD motif